MGFVYYQDKMAYPFKHVNAIYLRMFEMDFNGPCPEFDFAVFLHGM